MPPVLLSAAFCAPVEYFSIIGNNPGDVYVDDSGNYSKQTWRNRCRILSEGGPLDLRFPIVHDGRRRITDVRIDYSTPWLRQMKYAIESAYSSTPFFEYYRDEFFAVLDSVPQTLWEMDRDTTGFFCRKIGLPAPSYSTVGPDFLDCRDAIHPKKPSTFVQKPYYQVFGGRYGFVPGLSVMDLLFNEGPESICYL